MIPAEFLSRMQNMLGEDFAAFESALSRPLAKGIRFSSAKRADLQALPWLKSPVPWAPGSWYYDGMFRPGKHPWHEAGVYYLQEPSAMAPATLLHPMPGERVLDLCAAPGGKATQLADAMAGQGILVANEINPKRAKILSRNIERMGIRNALVLNMHPRDLRSFFPLWFDRILVDAPCSGEGMFRKEAAASTDWSQETVRMCAARQQEILSSAAEMLRPGGVLCYSTCTFSPEENEGVISVFLSRHPEFSLMKISVPWFSPGIPEWGDPVIPDMQYAFRLWPHKLKGEGHFTALLQKDGDLSSSSIPMQKTTGAPDVWRAFSSECAIPCPHAGYLQIGEHLYLVPDHMPDLSGLRFLRAGLDLGTIRKGRFEPAHALALTLDGAASSVDFSSDSVEITRYLAGQVLPGSARGWTLITTDGYAIGWAKGSGGQLKNHYPKGLRALL